MLLDDEFIESVITPETQTTNPSETMEISREFYGMEAVAQFDEQRDDLGRGLDKRQEEAIDAFNDGGDE